MVIYNGQIVEPKIGSNNVLFVYKNNNVSSCYSDSFNVWKNEGQHTVVISNLKNDSLIYYAKNNVLYGRTPADAWYDGLMGWRTYSHYTYKVDNTLFDTARFTDANRVTPLTFLVPAFVSNASSDMVINSYENTLDRPPVRFENSELRYYLFGSSTHNNANFTLDNCNFLGLYHCGMLNKYENSKAVNFSKLAKNCNIYYFHTNAPLFVNSTYTYGLNGCNIDSFTAYSSNGTNVNNTSINITKNIVISGLKSINNLFFNLQAGGNEASTLKNGLINIQFSADTNIGDVIVNTNSTNYWNRPMFNITCGSGYKLNFINGFPGNLINIFPRAAGYSNLCYPNAGFNIAFDTFGKAVSGEKNWTFYQPKIGDNRTTNFRYSFNSRNTTSKAYIPNISITGWTHNDGPNVYLTLSGVSCSNLIANMLTSAEEHSKARCVNIFNSYIGLTTAGYCIRAYGIDGFSYGNTYKNNGSIINSSILASSVSGTVTEFVMNDYSGHQMWNKNTICMQNVYLTGLNTQVRLNAYTDQTSTQNGFKFNRGNYFVRNLNLYYATWVPGVTTAIRGTPANIRFEFRTHWGGYWNSTYTNAMPVWNNMNGILRNVFSNIGPAGANITIDISPQYYTLSALSSGYANQWVLKNIFFGNDASASFGYTNANYGWINITSTMWGQTSGINVRIRRVSACNYANNRFYGNIYINTQ